jgi:MFS family permease
VLCSLSFLRLPELQRSARAARTRSSFSDGFRYVWKRRDLKVILVMLFLIGTFGLNFSIYISCMSVSVFHKGAGQFGMLMSTMAIGTVAGALLAARRTDPGISVMIVGAAIFGIGLTLAALVPSYVLFGCALVIIGAAAQTFTTTANSTVQLSTDPAMRGRVLAILLAITLGGTPLGGPIAGWIADEFGPRWSLGVGAASGFGAALVGVYYLAKYRHLRVSIGAGRLHFNFDQPGLAGQTGELSR